MKKKQTYTQPISEIVNLSFLVNNGDPTYGDDAGTTGIVTSGKGISATMAQTNESTFIEEEAVKPQHSSLWDE